MTFAFGHTVFIGEPAEFEPAEFEPAPVDDDDGDDDDDDDDFNLPELEAVLD